MRYHARLTSAIMLLPLLVACGDDSVPGTITVSLATTTDTTVGAVLGTIDGPVISEITTQNQNARIYWRATGDGSANFVIVGDLATGPLVEVRVPDVRQASSYSGTVREIVELDESLAVSPGSFRLVFTTPNFVSGGNSVFDP